MVDPIITYAFAIGFFVFILGSMLYLTFMDHPENERDAVGESVVGGVGAVDDQETAGLDADATGDADVKPREDNATAGVGAERNDETASGGSDGGVVDGATAGADEAAGTPTDEQTASEAAETDEE